MTSADRPLAPRLTPAGAAWRLVLWPAAQTWPLGYRLYTWGVLLDLPTIAALAGATVGALTGAVAAFLLRRTGT